MPRFFMLPPALLLLLANKRAGTVLRNVPKEVGPIKLTVKSAFKDEGNVARAAAVETGRSLDTPETPAFTSESSEEMDFINKLRRGEF